MWDQLQEALGKLQDKLLLWFDKLILALPNLLIAILIVIIGWVLARYVYRVVHQVLMRASGNQNVADLTGSIARVIVVALGLFGALSVLDLSGPVRSMLAGAGILGLAIGFALQDPLANLFSGVMMSVKELYKPGDLVETNDYFGIIQGITLRNTAIKTLQGQEVIIPNKDVLQNPLKNYSVNKHRRIDLTIGVSYGEDLDEVERLTVETVKREVEHIEERGVELYWTEFGDSSINGTLRFWQPANAQKDFLKSQSDTIKVIKRMYDKHDITIPFPIRTLDFDAKGGMRLGEVQLNLRGNGDQPTEVSGKSPESDADGRNGDPKLPPNVN